MAITVNNGGNPTAQSAVVQGKDGAGTFRAFQFDVSFDATANPVQPLLNAAGFTGMQAAVVSLFDGGGPTLTSGGNAILPVLDAGAQAIVFRLPSNGTVITSSAGALANVILTAWIRT
jgi:hypothetical protein